MREKLKEYNKSDVDIFISYITSLKEEKKDGKLVNYWATTISDDLYINCFKKVYSQGLIIDGDSVILTFRGKLIITYDYHAYKNKVSLKYPETIYDFGLVYKNDEFSFRKESGKVIYSHIMTNPFDTKKEIIGAYGIIKNRTGEFIETLDLEEISKMRKSSKMDYIWNTWFDRMVLKSIIKRICSVNFRDITKDIDLEDNTTNDPNRACINEITLNDIDMAETVEQLELIYKSNINSVEDKETFIKVLKSKKQELTK